MGLLTYPASSQQKSKYAKMLIKVNRRLCLFLYVLGIGWFCLLSHKDFNHATYFSENALLPGELFSLDLERIVFVLKPFNRMTSLQVWFIRKSKRTMSTTP